MSVPQPKSTPASEFCRDFGRYKDEAIEQGAIPVSSNGRPVGAYLSQREFEHYQSLKRRETKVHKIDELPDTLVEDIENAEYGVLSE